MIVSNSGQVNGLGSPVRLTARVYNITQAREVLRRGQQFLHAIEVEHNVSFDVRDYNLARVLVAQLFAAVRLGVGGEAVRVAQRLNDLLHGNSWYRRFW